LAERPQIDERVMPCLRYLLTALKHRFRYDVQIEDVPTIKVGEFDIELE